MNQQDKRKFSSTLSLLAGIYRTDLTPEMLTLYWETLKHLPMDEFMRRVNEYVRGAHKFFPRPNELDPQPDRAQLAWGLINEIMDTGRAWEGCYKFDDPVIHSAIKDMGGMYQLCACPIDRWQWKRKEFLDAYHAASHRQVSDHPEYIAGPDCYYFEPTPIPVPYTLPLHIRQLPGKG